MHDAGEMKIQQYRNNNLPVQRAPNAMSFPGVPGSKTIAKQKAKAKAKQNQRKQQQILTGASIIIVMR